MPLRGATGCALAAPLTGDTLTAARLPVTAGADAAWQSLLRASSAPFRPAGRWAWHWARGKLAHDPVFRCLLEQGHLRTAARVLDIGCGQGLLASLLQACAAASAQGHWPAAWPSAPATKAYTGIDLAPRDIERARRALQGPPAPTFVCADMRQAPLPACDVVVLLDVLHYIDHAAQHALLRGVQRALAASPGPGRLLLRVADSGQQGRFAYSQWVDRVVSRLHGRQRPDRGGRPLAQWLALLQDLGFQVQAVPMGRGTPFANVLLVADLPAHKRAPA